MPTDKELEKSMAVFKKYHQLNRSELEVISNGKPLEDELYDAIRTRQHTLVISMPGCGKTHNANEAARRALNDNIIGGIIHVEGSKDLMASALFEDDITIMEGGNEKVKVIPSRLRKELEGAFKNTKAYKLEKAEAEWQPTDYRVVILDEITRCSATFIDRLFTILNDQKATIQGNDVLMPVVFLLLGNPPGMDSTTSAFSHAFLARIFQRIVIRDVDLDTQASLFTKNFVERAFKKGQFPEYAKPNDDLMWLASAVRYWTWGLPLDRKGLAQLPDSAKQLIQEATTRVPELKAMMEVMGTLVTFGHDSRKPPRWLAASMGLAYRMRETISEKHLLRTAINCLSIGTKDNFSEGTEPDLQRLKEELIYSMAHITLTHPKLRDLILKRSPTRLAGLLLEKCFRVQLNNADATADARKAFVQLLKEKLDQHVKHLSDTNHPEANARQTLVQQYLCEILNQNLNQKLPDLKANLLKVAKSEGNRDRAILDTIDGEGTVFSVQADRDLLAALTNVAILKQSLQAAIGTTGTVTLLELQPLGEALAELAKTRVAIVDQMRTATAANSAALDFVIELRAMLKDRNSQYAFLQDHLQPIGAILHSALEREQSASGKANDEARQKIAEFKQTLTVEQQSLVTPFFIDLFKAILKAANKRYYSEQLKQLIHLLPRG